MLATVLDSALSKLDGLTRAQADGVHQCDDRNTGLFRREGLFNVHAAADFKPVDRNLRSIAILDLLSSSFGLEGDLGFKQRRELDVAWRGEDEAGFSISDGHLADLFVRHAGHQDSDPVWRHLNSRGSREMAENGHAARPKARDQFEGVPLV